MMMISKGRHPKKDIQQALAAAVDAGLILDRDKNGHRWAWLRCGKCGERQAIWSTPANPKNFAKKIETFADQHTH